MNGVLGAGKMKEAQTIADKAKAGYEAELSRTERATAATNALVEKYGSQQESARRDVVERMADFIRRHQRQVAESAADLLAGVEVEIETLEGAGQLLGDGIDWLIGAAKAGMTGAAVYTGVPAAVGALGSASTGTAIGSLSGAAAQSATGAWLGGGALASGGGGMALGATALNCVTIGPALLVGGLVLNGQGEKALTRAKKYEADVAVAADKQRAFRSTLKAVDRRVKELGRLLAELTTRATSALDELEGEAFDSQAHADRFRRAFRFTVAVRDLVSTRVLDEAGSLNDQTHKLLLKYRGMR